MPLPRRTRRAPYSILKIIIHWTDEKLSKISPSWSVGDGRAEGRVPKAHSEALLRPEPKVEDTRPTQGGLGLLGLTLAGFALMAIYISTPVDLPEWPDCPIQALGSCGEQ